MSSYREKLIILENLACLCEYSKVVGSLFFHVIQLSSLPSNKPPKEKSKSREGSDFPAKKLSQTFYSLVLFLSCHV
jgi:hypothetical protein